MSLIPWKNLPNTETPITAENLKNDGEYLDNKCEILQNNISNLNIYRKEEAYNENEEWLISIEASRGACIIVANAVSSTDNKGAWLMFANVSGNNAFIIPLIDNYASNITIIPLSNTTCKIKPRWYSRISVIPLISNVALTKIENS